METKRGADRYPLAPDSASGALKWTSATLALTASEHPALHGYLTVHGKSYGMPA
jgi:hypothetical protein